MGKYLKVIGFLILLFILLSNLIRINLSNAMTIVLGVLSALFMCVGIFISDKKSNKEWKYAI